MAGVRFAWALAAATALALAACDNGPSAVAQQAAGVQMARAPGAAETAAPAEAGGVDHRDDPVRLVDGRPMWSATRRYSAEENARRVFARNGEAFGAASLDQFVRRAHDFVGRPPRGTLTLTRANGDRLLYDPGGNVFAVATPDGAPRTMFKPDEGMAYWEAQKARKSRQTAGRRNREAAGDDEA